MSRCLLITELSVGIKTAHAKLGVVSYQVGMALLSMHNLVINHTLRRKTFCLPI